MSITKASLIDLNGQELILDADADTSITADTDDQIDIKIAGSDSIRIKANEIENVSGSFTLDSASDIVLDADGGAIFFKDGGTEIGRLFNSASDLILKSAISDQDLKLQGNDGGSAVNALILDMSAAGAATFNAGGVFNEVSADSDFRVESDGNANMLIVDAGSDVVLVGTNTINPQSASSGGNEGCMFGSGLITAGRAGGEIAIFNRQSSDGDIVLIRKDGTTIGNIGNNVNNLTLNGSNAVELRQGGTTRAYVYSSGFHPWSDATYDLGVTTARWKDLYLSGGLKIGGTDAAHTLDDYEESTFNTVLTGDTSGTYSTSGSGRLTKIGRLASVLLAVDNVSSSAVSGNLRISLPIAYVGSDMYFPVQVYYMDYPADTKTAYAYTSNGYTYVVLYWSKDNNDSLHITNSHLKSGGGSYIRANFNYTTA